MACQCGTSAEPRLSLAGLHWQGVSGKSANLHLETVCKTQQSCRPLPDNLPMVCTEALSYTCRVGHPGQLSRHGPASQQHPTCCYPPWG